MIDSWEDLYENNHVEIAALEQDTFTQYALDESTAMACDFASRITIWRFEDWYNDNKLLELAVNMSTGQTAMIKSKLTLKFFMLLMSALLDEMLMNYGFLEDMHISKYGAWNLPYFIATTKKMDHPHVTNLNDVYVKFLFDLKLSKRIKLTNRSKIPRQCFIKNMTLTNKFYLSLQLYS